MISLICAEGSKTSSIVVYGILILVLVAMLVLPYFTQKKKSQEFAQMLESMKVGDLVKTAGGIIGKITKITDKGDIKTVILETGSKTEKSYMEFDMAMIYCVLKSTKSNEEKETAEEKTEVVEEVVETAEVVEEPKTEEVVEATAEEKKPAAKKATAKKTTAKKTTTKKSSK